MLLGFLEAGLFVTDAECETVLDLCSTTHTNTNARTQTQTHAHKHKHTHTHTQTPRYNQLIAIQALTYTANNNI